MEEDKGATWINTNKYYVSKRLLTVDACSRACICACVRVCECVRVCMRAWVRACVRAYVCTRVHVLCVYMRAFVGACMRAHYQYIQSHRFVFPFCRCSASDNDITSCISILALGRNVFQIKIIRQRASTRHGHLVAFICISFNSLSFVGHLWVNL